MVVKIFNIISKLINKKTQKTITVKESVKANSKEEALKAWNKKTDHMKKVKVDESSFEIDNLIVKALMVESCDDVDELKDSNLPNLEEDEKDFFK